MKDYTEMTSYELVDLARKGEIELSVAIGAKISLETLDSGTGTRTKWDHRNGSGNTSNLLRIKDVNTGKDTFLRQYKSEFLYPVEKDDIDFSAKFTPLSLDVNDSLEQFISGNKHYDINLSGYSPISYVEKLGEEKIESLVNNVSEEPSLMGKVYYFYEHAKKLNNEIQRQKKYEREQKEIPLIEEFSKKMNIKNYVIKSYLRDSGESIKDLENRLKDQKPFKDGEFEQLLRVVNYSSGDILGDIEVYESAKNSLRNFKREVNQGSVSVINGAMDITINFNYNGEKNSLSIPKLKLRDAVDDIACNADEDDYSNRVDIYYLKGEDLKVSGMASESIANSLHEFNSLVLSLGNKRRDIFEPDKFLFEGSLEVLNPEKIKSKIISELELLYRKDQPKRQVRENSHNYKPKQS